MADKAEIISLMEEGIVKVPFCSCWLFVEKGRENRNGYSRVRYQGRELMAHRVVYELLIGPIPEGLFLDHLCKMRACCNPAHLEPVTPKENTYRGDAKLFGIHRDPITGEVLCQLR